MPNFPLCPVTGGPTEVSLGPLGTPSPIVAVSGDRGWGAAPARNSRAPPTAAAMAVLG